MKSGSSTAGKFSCDGDIENYLEKETDKIHDEPPADLSHLNGRLGVDMRNLVASYHGEGKNMRN